MTLLWEDVARLLFAVLVGGLIGAEREYRDKVAGFRTIIFICLGATLFTLFSVKLGGAGDPARIAANIVSGVGFLGAGAILRSGERVTGLTTAASIWTTAAIGLAAGRGCKVYIPSESDLLKCNFLYGYEEDAALAFDRKLAQREQEMAQNIEKLDQEIARLSEVRAQYRGAHQDTQHLRKNWKSLHLTTT